MSGYIRGLRQVQAVYYFAWCLFQRNWGGARREIEIIGGFAKPYKIEFASSFWESCRDNLGMSEDEVLKFKDSLTSKFGEESVD